MTDCLQDRPFTASLADLIERAGSPVPKRAVTQWNPRRSGVIDIRIDASGRWYYRGSEIERRALVQLFSSILRREAGGQYALVTPVEKLSIVVEDAPFCAVELAREGDGSNHILTIRTNVGDIVRVGREHPIRFELDADNGGLKPYFEVRDGLEALATRALALDLVALAENHNGEDGVWSAGAFFPFPALPGCNPSDAEFSGNGGDV